MIRPYKGRSINSAKPVYVYRNLADKHNHLGKWSLLQGALVVAHADDLVLIGFGDKPVEFIVRPGGFKRAQAEQAKNVHAFFKGSVLKNWPNFLLRDWVDTGHLRSVQYDFRRADRFFDVGTDTDISQAGMAYLNENGAYYA